MCHVPTSCLIWKEKMTQRDSISSNFLECLKYKASICTSKGPHSRIGSCLLSLELVIKFISEFGLSSKAFHHICWVYIIKENRLITKQFCVDKQCCFINSCTGKSSCYKPTFMHIYFVNLFTRHHFCHNIFGHSTWSLVLYCWCIVARLPTQAIRCQCNICNICSRCKTMFF